MTEDYPPTEEQRVKTDPVLPIVTKLLLWTTSVGHIVISIALVVATMVIGSHFFVEVAHAIQARSLFTGFLHALAILLLLWTMLELIQTELGFLRGEPIDVAVFIEVALVVVVREIILLPVENEQPTFADVGKWAGTAALLGLTYLFLRFSHDRFPLRSALSAPKTDRIE